MQVLGLGLGLGAGRFAFALLPFSLLPQVPSALHRPSGCLSNSLVPIQAPAPLFHKQIRDLKRTGRILMEPGPVVPGKAACSRSWRTREKPEVLNEFGSASLTQNRHARERSLAPPQLNKPQLEAVSQQSLQKFYTPKRLSATKCNLGFDQDCHHPARRQYPNIFSLSSWRKRK